MENEPNSNQNSAPTGEPANSTPNPNPTANPASITNPVSAEKVEPDFMAAANPTLAPTETPTPVIAEKPVSPAENQPNYPKNEPAFEPEKGGSKFFRIFLLILAIVILVWYFRTDNKKEENQPNNNSNVNISVDANPQQGSVTIINPDEETATVEKIKIIGFYVNNSKNPEPGNCGTVYSLEREVEKKYDSEVVNTMRGLLLPLSAWEIEQGYSTQIPAGTMLSYVKINNGMAIVNLNKTLDAEAGACAWAAFRAQITKTMMQFPYVSGVTICVNNNCL